MNHKEMQLAKQTRKQLQEALDIVRKDTPGTSVFSHAHMVEWRIVRSLETLDRLIEGKLEHGIKGGKPHDADHPF